MVFGKFLNKYYLRYFYFFLIGIATLVAVDFAQLKIPAIYRTLLTALNTGYLDEAKTRIFTFSSLMEEIIFPMLVIVSILFVGRFLWRVCFLGAGNYMSENLRKEMFDHARELSQNFYSKNKIGGLMSLFTNDLSTIDESFGWGVMMFFDATILGGLSLYDMFLVQPLLAAICLVPMAILFVVGMILNKYMMIKWDIKEEAFSKISDFAQESFSGIAVIKAFVKEAKELWAFKKLNGANEKANVEFTKMSVALRVSVTLFVESVICIILGFGGYLVWQNKISAEALLEFIGYFTSVVWPIMAISELIDMHSRGKASLKRISAFLEEKADVVDFPGAKDAGTLKGKIEFRNLDFSYPGSEREILSGVSFTVEAGESIGIIGRIGAGKTTVADILTRTYNVPDGSVFLDDTDVNLLTQESVRKNIAYVPQDNFLFSDTIAENISFASDGGGMEKVKEAAFLACVDKDVEGFESGYETVLGERGVTVSGGQKQRISIARAIMKDAPILILDDSVSAVDVDTESVIIKNLAKKRKGKTTILIAHRISTVQKMDKILFLEDGEVVAFGKHEDLLKSCEKYAEIVKNQSVEKEEVLV